MHVRFMQRIIHENVLFRIFNKKRESIDILSLLPSAKVITTEQRIRATTSQVIYQR